jgi:hypothetical protein
MVPFCTAKEHVPKVVATELSVTKTSAVKVPEVVDPLMLFNAETQNCSVFPVTTRLVESEAETAHVPLLVNIVPLSVTELWNVPSPVIWTCTRQVAEFQRVVAAPMVAAFSIPVTVVEVVVVVVVVALLPPQADHCRVSMKITMMADHFDNLVYDIV